MQAVSIGIPSYNGEKYIAEAIESVINQSVKVKDIFVVDDASKDNTAAVVKGLIDQYKSHNIRFIENKNNAGYQVNWNNCFENCTTKYLVILHQDDILFEKTIEEQLKSFEKHIELAIVGGMEDRISENGTIYKKQAKKEDQFFEKGNVFEFIVQNGTYIPCSSVMFDMDKIRKVGYFETDVLATDELYWPRVLMQFPIVIKGRSLISRRNHAEQTEWSDFLNKKEQVIAAFDRFKHLKDFEVRTEKKVEIEQLINHKFCVSLIGIGGAIIRQYQSTGLAFWYLGKSLKIDWLLALRKKDFYKVLFLGGLNSLGLYSFLKKRKISVMNQMNTGK